MSEEQHKIITIHDSDDLLLSKVEHDDVLFQAMHKIDRLEELVDKQGREIEQLRAELLHERQERLKDTMLLSTHQQSQEIPGFQEWVESGKVSTHRENTSSIPEDDIYDVGGIKYLKNNSQTQVSRHKQTQVKQANKAKGGDVSFTPDTLCLDTGFKQCVEVGMSKAKLAERFGVSESTVARAKRKL